MTLQSYLDCLLFNKREVLGGTLSLVGVWLSWFRGAPGSERIAVSILLFFPFLRHVVLLVDFVPSLRKKRVTGLSLVGGIDMRVQPWRRNRDNERDKSFTRRTNYETCVRRCRHRICSLISCSKKTNGDRWLPGHTHWFGRGGTPLIWARRCCPINWQYLQ